LLCSVAHRSISHPPQFCRGNLALGMHAADMPFADGTREESRKEHSVPMMQLLRSQSKRGAQSCAR